MIKYPPKTPNFFSYGDATKNEINQITHIFQRSTAQHRINILPLPLMLPQSQNENLQPPKITSIPTLSPRVEPVMHSPRFQTQESAPTPPPREQPSTSPSLGTYSNAWIKKFQNIRRYPRFSKPGKHKRHPGKLSISYAVTRANLGHISAPKQNSTLFPTLY